ncbi:MAG: bifunctional DNA primase/polymerase, partial [Thaumarchaeota archaeon]|nr:bifunctional DNA primase/polymerase [Nitrososphaerota archaeon]
MVDIDDLNTSSKVAEYLRSKGKNIIPIVSGTKAPPAGFKLADYFDKPCDYPIKDTDSIAILHGKISNSFGIDIDMKNGGGWEDAIHVVANSIDKILSKTMVVKTPRQGCHFIVEPIGDLPPKNAKYFRKDGVEIDIKTQGGYTLLPPSIHPEKQLGRYQFISETLELDPTDWLMFESHLAAKGFFLKEDIENKDLHSDYDLDKLLLGKFVRGSRRKSLNSLYCKMRVRRWSEKLCVKKIQEINRKLAEPLPDKELEYNIKYSESFFSHQVQPSLDDHSKST